MKIVMNENTTLIMNKKILLEKQKQLRNLCRGAARVSNISPVD